MRPPLLFLPTLILAACGSGTNHYCLEIDGPCYPAASPASFIVGTDPRFLDQSTTTPGGGYRASLHVGDTVTLHLVRDARGEIITASDTIRTVNRALSDSAAAGIVSATGGSALLIATHVGRIGLVLANGIGNDLYACGSLSGGSYGCARIGEVNVVSP